MYVLGQGCQVMPDGSVFCQQGPCQSITSSGVMAPGTAVPPDFAGFGPGCDAAAGVPGLPVPGVATGAGLPGGAALPGFGMPGLPAGGLAPGFDTAGFPGFFAPEIPPETMMAPFPWQEPGTLPPGMPVPGVSEPGTYEDGLDVKGAPTAGRLAAVGGFGAAVLAALALGGTFG